MKMCLLVKIKKTSQCFPKAGNRRIPEFQGFMTTSTNSPLGRSNQKIRRETDRQTNRQVDTQSTLQTSNQWLLTDNGQTDK